MSNSDIKQHISISERIKWDKCIADLEIHTGSSGVENHALGNGSLPGFSMNNFTNDDRVKLDGIEDGALNNPHPDKHTCDDISDIHKIARTGSWNDLEEIPTPIINVINNTYDSATVGGGIRVTIGTEPENPQNNKELWIDTAVMVLKIRLNGAWQIVGASYR